MEKKITVKKSLMNILDAKFEYFTKNSVFFLIIIGSLGAMVRLSYFPFGIPLTLDGLNYFSYAYEMSQTGYFPVVVYPNNFPNNGWPSFLSLVFSIFYSENLLDYMVIQRSLTIAISVLTMIPVYLLCSRFFEKSYALIGATLFVLDPRIILNSVSGISEPVFIILFTIALFLFCSTNKKNIYTSFGIAALFALVRFEGLLLIIPFSIIFFLRFKKERNVLFRYFLAVGIFILVLFPMALIRIDTMGHDGLISHLWGGFSFVSTHVIQNIPEDDDPPITDVPEQNTIIAFFWKGIFNLIKFGGWVSFPLFFLFLPIGFFMVLKNRNYKKITIVLVTIFLLIPAFYGYGRNFQETRYLYVLIPILCILSLYSIKMIIDKFKNSNIILPSLVVVILLVSLVFLDYKRVDYELELEEYEIAKYIVQNTKGIDSSSYLVGRFIHAAELIEKGSIVNSDISVEISKSSPLGFSSLEEFISASEKNGLTHLVLDGQQQNQGFGTTGPYVAKSSTNYFLNDVFFNDKKYPYLIKEFDSSDHGYKYHVKIYRIDYKEFYERVKL